MAWDDRAPDVHAALGAIVAKEAGVGRDEAEDQLKRLQQDKRYHRDVY